MYDCPALNSAGLFCFAAGRAAAAYGESSALRLGADADGGVAITKVTHVFSVY